MLPGMFKPFTSHSVRLVTQVRLVSSLAMPNPGNPIHVSKSTDPYFNLTYEDWLFRHAPADMPLLFMYRDDPCVVIGRNQNPWKEVNLSESRSKNIPFIRRRSGGGTVYHDHGNTNFSIHLPRTSFDRHKTAKIILKAVRSLGIDARVNERNDICVGHEKICSAYKIVNKRAYHHGTMLISSQLDTLGDLLRTNKETMVTRGVASVRSPVCNLQQFDAVIKHDDFIEAVVASFREAYDVQEQISWVGDQAELRDVEYIHAGISELQSWDWLYGQTPDFTYVVSQNFDWGEVVAELHSKHGLLLSCEFRVTKGFLPPSSMQLLAELGLSLQGARYGFLNTETTPDGPVEDVFNWIKTVMEN